MDQIRDKDKGGIRMIFRFCFNNWLDGSAIY